MDSEAASVYINGFPKAAWKCMKKSPKNLPTPAAFGNPGIATDGFQKPFERAHAAFRKISRDCESFHWCSFITNFKISHELRSNEKILIYQKRERESIIWWLKQFLSAGKSPWAVLC